MVVHPINSDLLNALDLKVLTYENVVTSTGVNILALGCGIKDRVERTELACVNGNKVKLSCRSVGEYLEVFLVSAV